MYPFMEVKLDRADVEWLLAMHESGGVQGPIDWDIEEQRSREGLDLRGAIFVGVEGSYADLHALPLSKVIAGERQRAVTDVEPANIAIARFRASLIYQVVYLFLILVVPIVVAGVFNLFSVVPVYVFIGCAIFIAGIVGSFGYRMDLRGRIRIAVIYLLLAIGFAAFLAAADHFNLSQIIGYLWRLIVLGLFIRLTITSNGESRLVWLAGVMYWLVAIPLDLIRDFPDIANGLLGTELKFEIEQIGGIVEIPLLIINVLGFVFLAWSFFVSRVEVERRKKTWELGAVFFGADLREVHLEGAILGGCYFNRADLRGAHLESAVLDDTELFGTDLRGAFLDGVTSFRNVFFGARKRDSVALAGVHWGGADLSAIDWKSKRQLGDEREAKMTDLASLQETVRTYSCREN